jgi:hypothetical protein
MRRPTFSAWLSVPVAISPSQRRWACVADAMSVAHCSLPPLSIVCGQADSATHYGSLLVGPVMR